jgi:MFS family permease
VSTTALPTPRFKLRDLVEFQGYRQGGIAFLQYGVGVGAVYFIVAPLLGAMLPDVKWSLSVVSSALLIRGLLGIVIGPLCGFLVARYGVRRIVLIGGVSTAAFTAATGLVRNPLEFGLIFGVALAFADNFMSLIPATTIVSNWFMHRRAVVMGFVNSGAGFGGLVFSPLMAVLVREFGWRHALYALGLIILVLALPAIWLRSQPSDVGQWVDGVEGRQIPPRDRADDIGSVQTGLRRMLHSPVYWMLFVIFGIESWSLGVYSADQVLYLDKVGVGSLASSSALGLSAGIAAVSGIIFSRLSDRTSPYYVIIGSTTMLLAGSIVFINVHGGATLWIYSIMFGAGYGLLVPTIPVAVSRYFGALDFSKAFGVGQIIVASMGGLGPYVTGKIVDATGSFRIPIYLITGLLIVALIVAILARPPRVAALEPLAQAEADTITAPGPSAVAEG